MSISFPDKAREVITSRIPAELIKERKGGGGMMLSYISGQSVIDMLNSAFDYMWDWRVEEQFTRESEPFMNRYSKNTDAPKVKDGWGNDCSLDEQGPVAHVRGVLTVFIPDGKDNFIPISKSGFGSKSVMGKQNDQESIYKAAGTDALKKAASLLGIGLELYRDEDEQSYFDTVSYIDPWTDELEEEFSKQREYLAKISEDYSLDSDAMNDLVHNFSEGAINDMRNIVPDNIVEFSEFIKEQISALEQTDTVD